MEDVGQFVKMLLQNVFVFTQTKSNDILMVSTKAKTLAKIS